jgi:hypothetical protein
MKSLRSPPRIDVREFEGQQGMAFGNDVIAVVAVNDFGAAHVA